MQSFLVVAAPPSAQLASPPHRCICPRRGFATVDK
jgi:hypothetical protein